MRRQKFSTEKNLAGAKSGKKLKPPRAKSSARSWPRRGGAGCGADVGFCGGEHGFREAPRGLAEGTHSAYRAAQEGSRGQGQNRHRVESAGRGYRAACDRCCAPACRCAAEQHQAGNAAAEPDPGPCSERAARQECSRPDQNASREAIGLCTGSRRDPSV